MENAMKPKMLKTMVKKTESQVKKVASNPPLDFDALTDKQLIQTIQHLCKKYPSL
jgi:hypothetical protein